MLLDPPADLDVQIRPKPPLRRKAGRDLNYAVEAKTDQRYTPGDHARNNRYARLHSVVPNGYVIEKQPPPYQPRSVSIHWNPMFLKRTLRPHIMLIAHHTHHR